MEGRGDIPALTGLRFVAAATIALSHFSLGSGFAVLGVPLNLSAIGMPLFFVLSGFIVHYVYAASFARNWRTAAPKFALARFSRLYPLFFTFLLFYLLWRLGPLFYAHPWIGLSYGSLTGSWWYWTIDGQAMPQLHYGISWSISTEVFFYLVYALGLYRIDRIASARLCAAALAGLCAIAFAILYVVFATQDVWESSILALRPQFIASSADFSNSFLRWLLYISPYFHILEFTAGCLTCQLFLLMRRTGEAGWGGDAEALAWLGAAWIIAAQLMLIAVWYLGYKSGFLSFVNFLHITFLMAPGCCLLILALALGGTSIGRMLAHRVPTYLGEISYSIYLGHPFAFSFMILIGLSQPTYTMTLGLLLVIAGASAFYFLIEVPAKDWLRTRFTGGASPVQTGKNAALRT